MGSDHGQHRNPHTPSPLPLDNPLVLINGGHPIIALGMNHPLVPTNTRPTLKRKRPYLYPCGRSSRIRQWMAFLATIYVISMGMFVVSMHWITVYDHGEQTTTTANNATTTSKVRSRPWNVLDRDAFRGYPAGDRRPQTKPDLTTKQSKPSKRMDHFDSPRPTRRAAPTKTLTFDPIPLVSANSTLPNSHEQSLVRTFLQQVAGRSFLPLVAVLETPSSPFSAHPQSTPPLEQPLPIRDHVNLTTVSYPHHIQSCRDIPNQWPVGHSQDMDRRYGTNVGEEEIHSLYPIRHEYAQTTCPVDADPFLPWIHDVFVDGSGQNVHIVAHNKRRCNRYPKQFAHDIANLEPQVALMQSVPIQRLDRTNRNHSIIWDNLYSQLPVSWREGSRGGRGGSGERSDKEHWYRLVPLEDADAHSQETRFLCQFFTLRPVTRNEVGGGTTIQGVEKVIVGETWSTFPYNYEHANFQHRRGQQAKPMLTRPVSAIDSNGIHNDQVWNAILDVKCPLPDVVRDEEHHRKHHADVKEVVPSFYMDLVPVRTPPRETLTGYSLPLLRLGHPAGFDPVKEWGDAHVLPPVSHSGRWANIPICPSSIPAVVASPKIDSATPTKNNDSVTPQQATSTSNVKPYYMVGCIWASAVFSERGKSGWDTHTSERMLEWLTYHLEIAGFDHWLCMTTPRRSRTKHRWNRSRDCFLVG